MKYKQALLLTLTSFWLLNPVQLKSQNIVSGIVKDAAEKSLALANVFLLKSPDSFLVKGTITDSTGKYSFENIQIGKYLVTASITGMTQNYTKVFEITPGNTAINTGVLTLRTAEVALNNITVTTKKAMFEQRIDRMVINVKNSVTGAGSTALDVLEKSPGITVNRQSNTIAINGKKGVAVMINGKINYMPMEALVQLLAATSSDNIEKIELITTPPSKYDAEGNAGYINIVFIHNPYAGFNGSYFFTAGYGNRESGSAGINFNYRNAKVNFYGNYVFKDDHYIQPMTGLTQFINGGNLITNRSFSDRDAVRQVQNIRIGLDYTVDTATIISALAGGYISNWSMTAVNGATISKNNITDTIVNTFNSELNDWKNMMANLNVQHTFKRGSILYFDANYIYYKDDNPNIYSNTYYNNAMQFLSHDNLKSGKVTPIHFWVFSSDYSSRLNKKVTMENGIKVSISKFNNEAGLYRLKEGIYVTDDSLSANYLLKENIAAAYTSLTIQFNKSLTMKAGLRYEFTSSNLGTTATANIIDRKYGELFPTFYISQKLNDDNGINFSYNRRITRPAFTDLAPFTIFFDPKTFFSGNPALQPALANTVSASYALKNKIFSLSYTNEQNTIENYYFQTQRIDTVSNILYLSADNFKNEQYLTVSSSLPFTVTKWWSVQNNINLNWRKINTSHYDVPIHYRIFNYTLSLAQRFTLPKDFSVELTGFYSSASYFGSTKFKAIYQLDAGLQKKFNNNKDILRLTANDVFNSGSNYRFVDNLAVKGALINRNFNFGLVACRLNYTHNFGNKALKGKRERSTGAEDELKRVNN